MRRSYSFLCKTSNIKYACQNCFNQNKLLFLSLLFICIVGLLTGIFVALKCGITTATLKDFNLQIYTCEDGSFFGNFFSRFISCFGNVLLLFLCSLAIFITPVGHVLVAYRCYLVGFNTTLLITLFGISGAISGIIIILPCQLVITAICIVYFVLMCNRRSQKKKFGRCDLPFLKPTLLFALLLLVICLTETLLLTLFSVNTILVL